MRRVSVWAWLALLLAALMLAAGCGGDDDEAAPETTTEAAEEGAMPGEGKPPVTLGTKDFTEEFILGELYKQALEAKGYTVRLKKNIGSTEIIDKSLTSGEIDGYPEYLGVTVAVVARKDIIAKSAEETYNLAKEFYEGRGQTVSERTPFFDVDAIGTTKEFAEKNGLETVADLKKLESFTVGGRPEFRSRYQGLKGMRQAYGLNNAKFKQLAIGIQYQALDSGDVDTANVFSTDAQLASGKYKVLKDPKGVFGYQNVALVIDQDKLEQLGGDEFMSIINAVNAKLTNDAIISMNKAVAIDKKNEADVARTFLEANGLI